MTSHISFLVKLLRGSTMSWWLLQFIYSIYASLVWRAFLRDWIPIIWTVVDDSPGRPLPLTVSGNCSALTHLQRRHCQDHNQHLGERLHYPYPAHRTIFQDSSRCHTEACTRAADWIPFSSRVPLSSSHPGELSSLYLSVNVFTLSVHSCGVHHIHCNKIAWPCACNLN